MANPRASFDAPYLDAVVDKDGFLNSTWAWFFRKLNEIIYPLGIEQSFAIVNNQASAADVTGMKFSKRGVSMAIVEFLIQRVTTSTGAVELVEAGSFIVSYNPTSDDWNIDLLHINSPDNSGVDFTITSAGQVQYTSSNETGTASISKLHWRARTLAGKHGSYSQVGAR